MPAETDRRGESRWLPAAVVLVLVVMPLTVPLPRTGKMFWIVPCLAVPLLIAVLIGDPGRIDRQSSVLRLLRVALTGVLVAGAGLSTVRLIDQLLQGVPDLRNASTLLLVGGLVWIDTNLTFALLYWELDGGGAAARFQSPPKYPDLAFPQHTNPDLAPPGWMPTMPDYLYLGITNAVAFSPTDVMPMAHWAKLVMALQSIISVAILSLVIANAVNILG